MDPFPLSVSARVTTFHRASPRLNISFVFSCGESYHYIWISIIQIASSCASDFAHWIFLSYQYFPSSQNFQIANIFFCAQKLVCMSLFFVGVLRHRKMWSNLEIRPFFCLREINASIHNSASLTNYLDFQGVIISENSIDQVFKALVLITNFRPVQHKRRQVKVNTCEHAKRKHLRTKDKYHLKESRMDRLRVFTLFAYIAHMISSAICTALSAAPFFIWSPQTKISSPDLPGCEMSWRIRPTKTSSLFDASRGVGKTIIRAVVDYADTWSFA